MQGAHARQMARALRIALALGAAWTVGCGSGGEPSDSPGERLLAAPAAVSSTAPARDQADVPRNTHILAVFSNDQDPESVTGETFTLRGPAGAVAARVSYDALTSSARLVPDDHLAAKTRYTATLTRGVRDRTGTPLSAEYSWSFTTGSVLDEAPPTVVSVETAATGDGSATNTSIAVTFSEVMDPSSIADDTITVTDAQGREIEGTVDYSGRTATFTPVEDLLPDTVYEVTVGPGGQDLAGNPVVHHSAPVATGNDPDRTGPFVVGSAPERGEEGVLRNRSIAVYFSEPISPATATTQTILLQQGAGFVPANVACIGSTAIVSPAAPLAANTVYTVTVTEAVTDLAGNPHPGPDSWSFSTGVSLDTEAPRVLETVPAGEADQVDPGSVIRVSFDEPSNPFVFGAVDGIPGTVIYDFATASFTLVPAEGLQPGTRYTATITARDLAGVPTTHRWEFTTAP